ncbi:uncharacterized protein DMAD_03141 [Drosophila madeirensis]|uniref:Activating transcription factor 7-interacting protein Fn3 domain-containing protein n=1 Tax=Drosophila madeirensis TaxID=30013 RepID=A0AAU9G6N7_DROMD
MMEISQNAELEELSTEGAIMGAIPDELNDETSPIEIGNGSRQSSGDDDDLKELTNGNGAIEIACLKSVKDDNILEERRNAGNDLDALLDKISSIVDCPRDSPASDQEAEQEPEAAVVELPADDGDKEEEINPVVGKEITADPNKEEDKKAVAGESSVTRDSVEKIQAEDSTNEIEGSVQAPEITEELDPVEAEDDVESMEKVLDKKEDSESVKELEEEDEVASHVETPAEKTNGDSSAAVCQEKLRQSSDDLFMDALDSISSSDDFGASSQEFKKSQVCEEKTPKAAENKLNARESPSNDLDDISSDEDILREKAPDKDPSTIPVIDLDSSDECVVCEEDLTEDKKTVADLAKDQTKITDDITEDKAKESLEDTTSADPMDVDEENKKTADPEDTQEPEDKTQTEQTMETTSAVDEMATEVTDKETDKDADEKVAKETENKAPEEDKMEPTTNGVPDRDSEILQKKLSDGKGMELELYKGKVSPEGAAKDADSDDEVIFFEPIEKPKDSADPTDKKELKSAVTNSLENDVVLVSEDEEEELPEKKPEDKATNVSEKVSSSPTPNDSKINPEEPTKSKELQADNSDNACDQFEKLKPQDKIKTATVTEDRDSSSSSNLLCPAETVQSEGTKHVESGTAGKATSDVEEEEVKSDADADPENKKTRISNHEAEPITTLAKRSHDSLDSSPSDGKDVIPSKKIRTDDSDSSCSNDGTLQIDLEVQDKEVDSELVQKEDPHTIKDQKELKLQLKPEPELKADVKPLRLEFLKSFRKSFDHMTRNDLEELVLQKVVEGMMVKSDFADIRSQLDKYEKTLAIYRRRIAEVSKQFLDLDTVHKRVLKDLETKNAHFTAPVRITRAVGLQVGIPFKVMKPNAAPSGGDQTHAAGSIFAAPSTPSKASTSPLRSPLQAMRGAGSGASSNAQQQQPQQQQHQQQQKQKQNQQQPLPAPRSSASYNQSPAATATAPAPPVRRGCLQKVTPQRPVPGTSFPAPQANNQSNNSRVQASPPGTQRPMHASKHTGSTASAAAMRNRSPYTTQKQQYQTSRSVPVPGPSQGKQGPKCATKVRAMPPKGTGIVSVPVSAASSSGGSALNYGQQQPNLAPAKPKEKAVIDLTDEDDAAAAMAAAASAAEANARLRQTSNLPAKRNSMGTTMSEARTAGGRTAVNGNTVRLSPLQMPRANARQIVTNNSGGQRSSLGSNVTMQIRSENTPPAATRLRYSHPAPLPSSPAQPFNPAWKLPPSRPLIRISLMDTGIVISWNLEDASSRFADCVTYQIFAYQETLHEPSTDSWRHVGDVKAMLLPMVATLRNFEENQRYHFALRGVDAHQRFGSFSVPKTWS